MISTVSYAGFPGCVRLENDDFELVLTTAVGPRILRFARRRGENVLWEEPGDRGVTGGDDWRIYGGHRLWCAPEDRVATYAPDNEPVHVDHGVDEVVARAPAGPHGVAKRMGVRLEGAGATLVHELVNEGSQPVTVACWALTCMVPGGVASVEAPPRREHPDALLPDRRLVLWPYTDPTDPRLEWRPDGLRVHHDPSASRPVKVGFGTPTGALHYDVARLRFTKRFAWLDAAPSPGRAPVVYPDLGCNAEIFADASTLELESLAPLVTLEPGEAQRHEERWTLETRADG